MKTRWIAGAMILALTALSLSGCASKPERYETAAALYGQAKYADAGKAFRKLKDYEDAEARAEVCERLASFQNPDAGKRFVSGWLRYNSRSFIVLESPSFGTGREDAVERPVGFVDWALDYAEDEGDRLGFAAAYPYIRQAWDAEKGHAFFSRDLDDYIGQLLAQYALYRENPALAAIFEKYDCARYDGEVPLRTDFCQWIQDEPANGELLDVLGLYVEKPEDVSYDAMRWDRARLMEYFGTSNYHSSRPERGALLLVAESGSKADSLDRQRALLLRAAPECHIADDPDCASVFIYYLLTRDTRTYLSSGGFYLHVHVGTAVYTAVDARTGETIAEASFQGKAPEEVYGTGGENYCYDPDEAVLERDEHFVEFIEAIRGRLDAGQD